MDTFSKMAGIAVIKNKQPDELIRGLEEIFKTMGNQSNYTVMRKGHLIHLSILYSLMKIISSIYRL